MGNVQSSMLPSSMQVYPSVQYDPLHGFSGGINNPQAASGILFAPNVPEMNLITPGATIFTSETYKKAFQERKDNAYFTPAFIHQDPILRSMNAETSLTIGGHRLYRGRAPDTSLYEYTVNKYVQ